MLARRNQRGLSLIELMVGIAVGLLVVAGAATVTVTQLGDSRRLVVEAQIQQDLRATADIMTRELRRAGSWDGATTTVWSPTAAVAVSPIDGAELVLVSASQITVKSYTGGATTTLEFRRSGTPGVIQVNQSGGGWQKLSDDATVDITGLQFQVNTLAATPLACPANCPGPGSATACWPTVEVREVQVQITGQAISDSRVVRSINTSVRLPNDRVVNNYLPGTGVLCPPP